MERMGLAPGTELGGYRVLAPLGQGGMGAVYRAVDADGVGVALKLLHPHLADGAARDRLAREVAALQKVRHRGVARVLDAELDSSEAFVVTELVEGTDLASSVAIDGPLGGTRTDELADLAESLADALDAVHAAGVLHRDLTPGNVMVTADGPVLIDFGIAQVVEDGRFTTAGQVAGTPGYLSPELLAGAEPGRRDDWWGWAAVLAFAATGRPPFGVRPLAAVLARVSSGRPDLAGLEPRLAEVLGGALAPEAADRTAPRDVVSAVRRIAEDGPVDDRAEDLDDSTGPTQVLGAGGTRVLGVAGGIGSGSVAGAPPPPPPGPPAPPGGAPYPPGPEWTAVTQVVRPEAVPPGEAERGQPSPQQYADPYPPQFAEPYPPQDEGQDDPGELPAPAPRRGTVLALGAAALAAGTLWPGYALLAVVVLAVVARSVGLDVDAHLTRRARRGQRRTDTARAVLLWPWYLVRGVIGVFPAALVAASAALLVGGVGWWVLGSDRLVLVPAAAGEAGELGSNAPWLTSALLAVTVLVAVSTVWFGPASARTRRGARWVLGSIAPGPAGAAVLVFLGLAVAAVLTAVVLQGTPIDWWPLTGPPSL
ncbi:serine/threonine-protein kinase [Actinotalea sp.]|uniref:serine/threonine-protein kinase n=1 Tax=Actinotalea sp. TaxID=1872145 RepID=UPI003564584A